MLKAKPVPTPSLNSARTNPSELSPVINAVGKPLAEPKTSGIKVRGTGAATKGLMARGPMA